MERIPFARRSRRAGGRRRDVRSAVGGGWADMVNDFDSAIAGSREARISDVPGTAALALPVPALSTWEFRHMYRVSAVMCIAQSGASVRGTAHARRIRRKRAAVECPGRGAVGMKSHLFHLGSHYCCNCPDPNPAPFLPRAAPKSRFEAVFKPATRAMPWFAALESIRRPQEPSAINGLSCCHTQAARTFCDKWPVLLSYPPPWNQSAGRKNLLR
jgi:hypothetical protein